MRCGVVQGLEKALTEDFELDVDTQFRSKRASAEAQLARQLNYQNKPDGKLMKI